MYLWKFISLGCKGVRCKRFAVRVNGDNGNNSCMLNLFVIYKDMLVLCIHVCMYTYTNTHSPHKLLEDLCDILKLYKKQTKNIKDVQFLFNLRTAFYNMQLYLSFSFDNHIHTLKPKLRCGSLAYKTAWMSIIYNARYAMTYDDCFVKVFILIHTFSILL